MLHTCSYVWLTGVCAPDIFMGTINSHWSPQVTALFEGPMGKWQPGRRVDKAIWEQTKAMSLGNPECFCLKTLLEMSSFIFCFLVLMVNITQAGCGFTFWSKWRSTSVFIMLRFAQTIQTHILSWITTHLNASCATLSHFHCDKIVRLQWLWLLHYLLVMMLLIKSRSTCCT